MSAVDVSNAWPAAFQVQEVEVKEKEPYDHPLFLACLWQMDDPSVGPKIPQALEKILQLKESRQEEMNSQQGESEGLQGQSLQSWGQVCLPPPLPRGGF